jgi:hypothetical protein
MGCVFFPDLKEDMFAKNRGELFHKGAQRRHRATQRIGYELKNRVRDDFLIGKNV